MRREPTTDEFDVALKRYLDVRDHGPTWRERVSAEWEGIRRHQRIIWVSLLIGVLIAGCSALARASERHVPDWVLRGIASQETTVHWTDMGVLSAKAWPKSTSGAVGPWHISLDVLRDLKLESQADRIHRDAVYAESVTRKWLLHLYRETGDWFEVCAAWRAGLNGRHRDYARAYAERARNYGTTY